MLKYIILFIALLPNICNYSQQLTWKWGITNKGQSGDIFNKIIIDHDQNILLTGAFIDGNFKFCSKEGFADQNQLKIFLSKLDKQGLCLWSKIILAESPNIPTITYDSENNIYLSGTYAGEFILDNVDISIDLKNIQGYIIKLDPDGNLIWYKLFKIKDPFRQAILINDIEIDQNDNAYLLGWSSSDMISSDSFSLTRSPIINGSTSTFLIKLNTTGTIQWGIFSEGNCHEEPFEIAFDKDDLPIVAGSYSSNLNQNLHIRFDSVALTLDQNDINIFIYKFDQQGKVIFGKSIGGPAEENGANIAVDQDNNIYLSGTFIGKYFVFANDTSWNQAPSAHTSINYLLLKLDPNGKEIWANSFWLGYPYIGFYSLRTDEKNNIYLYLMFSEDNARIGDKTLRLQGETDNLLLKYSADNKLIYAFPFGTSKFEWAIDMHIIKEDEIILAGNFTDKQLILGKDTLINEGIDIGHGMPDNIFIAKLSMDTATGTYKPFYHNIKVYPNPADDEVMIDLSARININEILEIKLINLEGKSMSLIPVHNNGLWTINTTNIPDGMYILQVKGIVEDIKSRVIINH